MLPLRVPVIVLLCAATTLSSVIPSDGEHKSSHDRIREKDLSDQAHFENEVHNSEYDHEAFLGEEANTFNDLSPEESKEKLGLLYDKIDQDKDGLVTEHELVEWIKLVQNRYLVKDTERQWTEYKLEGDLLDWSAYKQRTYGFGEDDEPEEDDDSYDYKDMLRRDKRRWEMADGDQDGKLTKTEFSHFLHPEEVEHMRSIVIEETLEDIDKDKDGRISLEEYIEDLYDSDDEEDEEFEPEWVKEERDDFEEVRDKNGDGYMDMDEITEWIYPEEEKNYAVDEAMHLILNADDADMWPQEEDEEPDWVKTEREQFMEFRDKNKDGFMDKQEVQDWIIPPDYDHSEAEGKHLIFEADANRDGKLTREEVLNKYDLFVGSQATDFGEALTRHDEF